MVKAFVIMNKYEVNILNPNIDELDNEYVILKLLEQHNNIVLTVYYNFAISFEFNITLNKIKSENNDSLFSLYELVRVKTESNVSDLTKVKYNFEQKINKF